MIPQTTEDGQNYPPNKTREENCNDGSKYRPISLVNIEGKVLEKQLINRTMHFLYNNELLNQNQFGFTPQKNTTDAAMAVKNFIEEALTKGQIVALVSLDVKGALFAAWGPSVVKALKDFYCPRNLYNLTKSYFTERTAFITTNSMRIETAVNKGCPQGSCCGPGYWNIQYKSLLNLNYAKWTMATAYADDLLIAVKAETIAEVESFTNIEMTKIKRWSKENKLQFNDNKSQVMLISRRRKERKSIDIHLNNSRLEQVDKMKYLVIIIKRKFTFNEHTKHATDRSTMLINALSKSARISWGLRHEVLKIIYNGAILPQLLYAAPVWTESMKRKYNRAKYIRVQKLINLRIAKAYRTVLHEALCILTATPPINIKPEEAVALYNIITGRSIQKYQLDKEENPRNWLHPADAVKVTDTSVETTDGQEDRKHNIHIYTDGSRNERGVGSGIFIFKDDKITDTHKYRLDGRCTNNQAEELAILKALENIQNLDTAERTVQILTDSRTTSDSLKNRKNHTHLIEQIRKKLI